MEQLTGQWKRWTRWLGRGALAGGLVLAVGCAHAKIPGTNIEDNKESHAILDVLEKYRTAVESRDVAGIVTLLSPKFRDSGGTPGPEDDLDVAELQRTIPRELDRVKDLRLDLEVRSIHVDHDVANAIFFYNEHFKLPGLTTKPQSESDLMQMWFHREGGQWKIVSGL